MPNTNSRSVASRSRRLPIAITVKVRPLFNWIVLDVEEVPSKVTGDPVTGYDGLYANAGAGDGFGGPEVCPDAEVVKLKSAP